MADHNSLLHKFVSVKADDPDTTLVRPTNWNEEHTFAGGSSLYYGMWDATKSDNFSFDNIWSRFPYIDLSKPPYSVTTGTDITSAINTAMSNLPTLGGVIQIPAGAFTITSTISVTKKIIFVGMGNQDTYTNPAPATVITKNSSVQGFLFTVPCVQMHNLVLDGQAGNLNDGIVINAPFCVLTNVSVFRQGQDGIRIGKDASSPNSNLAQLSNIVTSYNGRHGLFIKHSNAAVPDANSCVIRGLLAQGNTSDGIRVEQARFNYFYGVSCELNGRYGFSFGPSAFYNAVIGADLNEANVTKDLIFEGSTSSDNYVVFTTINETDYTDSSGSTRSNFQIFSQSGGGGAILTGVFDVDLSGSSTSAFIRNTRTNGVTEFIANNESLSGSNSVLRVLPTGVQIGNTTDRAISQGLIKYVKHGGGTVNPGTITAHTTADTSITVTGAQVGDRVIATPGGDPGTSFVWSAFVGATDTVKIRIANITTSNAAPTSLNWNIAVIRVV